MAIAMVAMLAFGGTYAYFTATLTTPVTNKDLTTATVQLGAPTLTTITKTTKIVPGMALLNGTDSITINNNSDTEVFIFVTLDVYAEKKIGEASEATKVTFENEAGDEIEAPFAVTYSKTGDTANFTKLTGVTGVNNVYYVKTSAVSVNFADQITLSTDVFSTSTESTVGNAMAATVVIEITAEAIQSYTFNDDAVAAYIGLHSDATKAS